MSDVCGHVHCKAGTRTPPHRCILPAGHDDPFHADYSGGKWLWEHPPRKLRVAS